ncbi:MAG: fused MFS/spermidine synthase [Candidatus Eremiobacterota bacterium]
MRLSLLFFFLSGMTGLVYEVLWTRRLTLTFGHTVLAVSTVLTAYMAGLALGSLAGGRYADRRSADPAFPPGRLLAIYGALEFFVGAWALMSLPLLGLAESAYLALSHAGWTGLPLHLSCFVGSLLALLPPTAAMGATLPIMTRLWVRQSRELGSLLSRVYGINTLGAFLGAGLSGFLLLPTLGLRASLLLAAFVNLAIGAAAFKIGTQSPPGADLAPAEPPSPSWPGLRRWFLPACFGAAGLASMVYQIGWTRGLALTLGSSVYAFSAILSTFLAGLGLGSLLYPRLMGRREPRLEHLAWLQVTVGVLGAVTIVLLGVLPRVFFHLVPLLGAAFAPVLATQVGLSGLVLGAPTFLMGLAFPLVSHLYARDLRLLGSSIGYVYGANTAGCIAGSFLGGFILVPALGTQDALKLAAAVNLLVGAALLASTRPRPALLVLLLFPGLLAIPRWDPGVMASGVVVQALRHQGYSDEQLRRTMFRPPAFYKDGFSCLVSVNAFSDGWRSWLDLRVNGKVDASLEQLDRQTMYLIGYLPGLLHPRPEEVAVIGLGGGLTVEALADIPTVESITCAELERTVVEAGRYWQDYNGHLLEDPRVRLVVTDGRTFVLGSPRKFDVIASEPSNVWIAGIANLFTRDFYRSCRAHLKPGGLMTQWLHTYGLSQDCLGYVMHSFFDVFPHGMVWQSNFGDVVLIGCDRPVPVDLERVRRLYGDVPDIQRNFFEIDLFQPEQLAGHYVMSREQALELFGQAPFNTDDRPVLEFRAPVGLYDQSQEVANFALLRTHAGGLPPGVPDTPRQRLLTAHTWINLGDYERAQPLLDGEPLLKARYLAATQAPEKEVLAAFEGSREDASLGPGVPPWLWARYLFGRHRFEEALSLLDEAAAQPPGGGRLEVLYWLGACRMIDGEPEAALAAFSAAADPLLDSRALMGQGRALLRLRRPQEALAPLTEAAKRNPADIEARLALGEALTTLGRYSEAAAPLEEAYRLMPDSPNVLVAMGILALHDNDRGRAADRFREAARLDPHHPVARKALSELGVRP